MGSSRCTWALALEVRTYQQVAYCRHALAGWWFWRRRSYRRSSGQAARAAGEKHILRQRTPGPRLPPGRSRSRFCEASSRSPFLLMFCLRQGSTRNRKRKRSRRGGTLVSPDIAGDGEREANHSFPNFFSERVLLETLVCTYFSMIVADFDFLLD